jgi:hypothetical protein
MTVLLCTDESSSAVSRSCCQAATCCCSPLAWMASSLGTTLPTPRQPGLGEAWLGAVLVGQGWSGPEHMQATAALATSASAVTAMAQEPSTDDRTWPDGRPVGCRIRLGRSTSIQRRRGSVDQPITGWSHAPGRTAAMAGKEPTGQSAITRSRMEATSAARRGWLMPRRRQRAGHRQQPPLCHAADGGRPPATRPCSVSSTCLGLPSVGANPSPRRRASGSIGRWVARVTWWPARCSPPPGPGRAARPRGSRRSRP